MAHWSVRAKKIIEFSEVKNQKLNNETIQKCSHVYVTQTKKERPKIYDICELWEDQID
jgi:hypothetical protein